MAFSPFAPKPAPRPANPRAELLTVAEMERQASLRRSLLSRASPAAVVAANRLWARGRWLYEPASRSEFEAVFGAGDLHEKP